MKKASKSYMPDCIKRNSTSIILFALTFTTFLLWLCNLESMTNASGDANEIWHTITTYYTDERYASYVLYKGFAAVYPYVWLYQLALVFKTNEFFFVMVYHALLFSYITVIGMPFIVDKLFKRKSAWWQRVAFIAFSFILWRGTSALNQIMVDLPSCAFFVLSVHLALTIKNQKGIRKYILLFVTGLTASFCMNISGQYSLAGLCVIVYALVKALPIISLKDKAKRGVALLGAMFIILGVVAIKPAQIYFDKTVVEPIEQYGGIISADVWLHRGLIYMMDKTTMFSNPTVSDNRGLAILQDFYGEEEGNKNLATAAAGGFGWTIKDYLNVVAHYPVDCLVRYLDRLFICLTVDIGVANVFSLALGYTLLYLTLWTTVKHIAKIKDLFKAEAWLILGFAMSVVPIIVLAVEKRYALSVQALVFGVAILGPAIPLIAQKAKLGIQECVQSKSIKAIAEKPFPWPLVICIAFVVVCLGYLGLMYAGSNMGTQMLFK